MDRERFLALDRSGKGLTDEEFAQGYHWCYEWDEMLVGPGQAEALVCSCQHPVIEAWKRSPEALAMQAKLEHRMDKGDTEYER